MKSKARNDFIMKPEWAAQQFLNKCFPVGNFPPKCIGNKNGFWLYLLEREHLAIEFFQKCFQQCNGRSGHELLGCSLQHGMVVTPNFHFATPEK